MILYQKENSSNPYNYDNRYCRDFCFLSHLHRDPELVYVDGGEIVLEVEGKAQLLTRGDFALVLPDQIHSYRTEKTSDVIIAVFGASYVPLFFQEMGRRACRDNRFRIPDGDRAFAVNKLQDPALLPTERAAVLNLAVSYFLKTVELTTDTAEEGSSLLLHKILQYISEHYRENISLEEMAERLGYESHYLSRRFHAILGKNFKQFVNEYRVQYAKQLIRAVGREKTMTEIAFDSGFSSVRNFNRAYKMVEGVEPRQHLP
jgi:AraC-like DNA-binding protein